VPMLLPDYRQQRLLALKHTFVRTHRVRRLERAELPPCYMLCNLYGRNPAGVWGSSAGALGRRTGSTTAPSRSVAVRLGDCRP